MIDVATEATPPNLSLEQTFDSVAVLLPQADARVKCCSALTLRDKEHPEPVRIFCVRGIA